MAETETLTASLARLRGIAAQLFETEGLTVETVARVRGVAATLHQTMTLSATFAPDFYGMPDTVTLTVSTLQWQEVDGSL